MDPPQWCKTQLRQRDAVKKKGRRETDWSENELEHHVTLWQLRRRVLWRFYLKVML